MNKFTGVKDIDFKILMNLDDSELGKVCQTNKYLNSLCKDNTFWFNKIHNKLGISFEDIKKFTIYLRNKHHLNTYIWIKEKEKILNSLLVNIWKNLENGNAMQWMSDYKRTSEFVQSLEYDKSFIIDFIVDNIINFSKGKSEKDRLSIFRLFGFLWRIVNFSDKYKNIKNDFMNLTK